MGITRNQVPILLAILVSFALAALPDPSLAQIPPPPVGTFNTQNCYNQMQNSYTNTQQAHTVMQQKVISNGPIPSFKIVYCWNSIIQPLINSISSLTTMFSANGAGSVATAIDALLQSLLNQVVIQLINTLCGISLSS